MVKIVPGLHNRRWCTVIIATVQNFPVNNSCYKLLQHSQCFQAVTNKFQQLPSICSNFTAAVSNYYLYSATGKNLQQCSTIASKCENSVGNFLNILLICWWYLFLQVYPAIFDNLKEFPGWDYVCSFFTYSYIISIVIVIILIWIIF